MSECLFCKAAEDVGVCYRYASWCHGCMVRMVAGGRLFWGAEREGRMTPEYRGQMEALFGAEWRTAHAEVKAEAERVRGMLKGGNAGRGTCC